MRGERIEIGVLDNDSMALERLTAVLPRLLPGLVIDWQTTSAAEAIRRCLDAGWAPAMLVADVELEGTTAMDVCRSLRTQHAALPVLAMTSYNPRTYAAALAAAGAQGIMVKGNIRQMAAALRAVSAGGTFSPVDGVVFPTAAQALQTTVTQRDEADGSPTATTSQLTDIERTILQRTSEGFTTEEIATELHVSPATIRSHTRRIRSKLGANTLSHAVAIWLMSKAVHTA